MKKTLWGYSIQEVDETVNYLETQTIKLERQVKQLTAELSKAQNELEEATAPEVTQDLEKDNLIAELRQKLEEAEGKNKELIAQNEALTGKVAEVTAEAAAKDPFENIGNICKQAYADIHISKQKAKDCLEGFLQEFWTEWKNYEIQLNELSEKLSQKQQKSREAFISYADYILKVYGDIEDSNNSFETQFTEIVKSKSKIECSLSAILSELDKDLEIEDSLESEAEHRFEPSCENAPEEESKISILAAIQKLNDSKISEETEVQPVGAALLPSNKSAETAAEVPVSAAGKDEMNISQKVNIRNII